MPVASLLVISCRFLGRERLGMTHGLERLETTPFDRRSQIDSADVCLVAPLPGSRRLHLDCKSRQLFVKGRAVSKLVAKIVRLYLGREGLEMTKFVCAGQTDSADACPAAPFPEISKVARNLLRVAPFLRWSQKLPVSTSVVKVLK